MPTEQQLQSDVRYVRSVVESAHAFPTAIPGILYMWAVIILTGFVMMDFGMSWFWVVGGPLGGVVSMWANRRYASDSGQIDQALSTRVNLHWAVGLAGGLLLSIPLQIAGKIDAATNGQIALLIIAICYFFAGLHLDRFMIWVSGVAAIAYGLTFFLSELTWTVPGAVIAAGVAAAGIRLQLSR